jgi:hypothetical protein
MFISIFFCIDALYIYYHHAALTQLVPASYYNDGGGAFNTFSTADKAWDGDTATFYDALTSTNAYTGIYVDTAAAIKEIRYFPRRLEAGRMNGAVFEGCNGAGGCVVLYTISSVPTQEVWTTVQLDSSDSYQFFQYRQPSTGHANVAEVQLLYLGKLLT